MDSGEIRLDKIRSRFLLYIHPQCLQPRLVCAKIHLAVHTVLSVMIREQAVLS